jgi:cytochrome P450
MADLQADALGLMERWARDNGDFFLIKVDESDQYLTSHPEAMHEIFVKQAAHMIKDEDYTDERKGLARFLGSGLLTSNGDFWKRQRKLVAPALHTKQIANYAQTMVEYTETMLSTWRDDMVLNMNLAMNDLTMRIVGKTLFNITLEGDLRSIGQAMEVIQVRSSGNSLDFLPNWVPTPNELRSRKAQRHLDQFVYGLINERRKTRDDRGDLLSMILFAEDEHGKHMTDLQARDEILTLFAAGHETTANTMNWTWMLLAQHPEVAAKLHAELDQVLGGRAPTLDDLKQLPYTEMVIKESLRLYPPAWSVGRATTQDTVIMGYDIPKGSKLGVFIYRAHRHPDFWEQPDRFMPERFAPENEGKIVKHAYAPFGNGPRICIGNSFAMMETQLLLATIAQHYEPRLLPNWRLTIESRVTMYPKGGLPMRLVKRHPQPQPTPMLTV